MKFSFETTRWKSESVLCENRTNHFIESLTVPVANIFIHVPRERCVLAQNHQDRIQVLGLLINIQISCTIVPLTTTLPLCQVPVVRFVSEATIAVLLVLGTKPVRTTSS